MGNPNLGHERQITFFPSNGHNHNGENSSPVDLVPGQVTWEHLDPALLDLIQNGVGDGGVDSENQLVPIPDLEIETNSIGAGASITGSVDWTGIGVIRFTRVVMSAETECTITFYHTASYAEEDREFRARRCGNKFLWEGAWVHYDEDATNKIHYKIENTGSAASRFNITLKAGTLVANGYANFVSSLQKQGSSTGPFIGNVLLQAGNGISITPNEDANTFIFDAVAPEAITVNRMALVPKKHVSFTSSTSTTNTGSGLNNIIGVSHYVSFGTGPQWMNMDYGAVYTVGRIVVTPYPDGRVYNDVIIQASADNTNWFTLMSQQQAMGTIQGIMVDLPTGFPMRYLRFWSNGSSLNTGNYLSGAVIYAISDKVGT